MNQYHNILTKKLFDIFLHLIRTGFSLLPGKLCPFFLMIFRLITVNLGINRKTNISVDAILLKM